MGRQAEEAWVEEEDSKGKRGWQSAQPIKDAARWETPRWWWRQPANEKNNNQQTMVCSFDAVENGGANQEGEQWGGEQQGGSAMEHILQLTKTGGETWEWWWQKFIINKQQMSSASAATALPQLAQPVQYKALLLQHNWHHLLGNGSCYLPDIFWSLYWGFLYIHQPSAW